METYHALSLDVIAQLEIVGATTSCDGERLEVCPWAAEEVH